MGLSTAELRNVCLWHKADIPAVLTKVRYRRFGGKADMTLTGRYVG
jgi:hypothetical protein